MHAKVSLNALLFALCLFSSAALSHPFASKTVSHRLDVAILPQQVRVYYTVDVPTALMGRRPDAAIITSMGNDLRNGLSLQLNGQAAVLIPTVNPTVTRDKDVHRFTLMLEAPIGAGPHHLRLSNGNLPDITAVHSAVVSVEGWLVLEDSLWRLRDDIIIRDDSDRWSYDPTRRTLDLTLRSPTALESWWTPSQTVDAAEARPPPRATVVAPWAALSLLLGLFAGWFYRVRRLANAAATRSAESTSD